VIDKKTFDKCLIIMFDWSIIHCSNDIALIVQAHIVVASDDNYGVNSQILLMRHELVFGGIDRWLSNRSWGLIDCCRRSGRLIEGRRSENLIKGRSGRLIGGRSESRSIIPSVDSALNAYWAWWVVYQTSLIILSLPYADHDQYDQSDRNYNPH